MKQYGADLPQLQIKQDHSDNEGESKSDGRDNKVTTSRQLDNKSDRSASYLNLADTILPILTEPSHRAYGVSQTASPLPPNAIRNFVHHCFNSGAIPVDGCMTLASSNAIPSQCRSHVRCLSQPCT